MINSLLSFSQIGYPKEVILGKDTCIALKYNQIREINRSLEEGEGCKVLLHETEKLVIQQDSLIKDGTALINNLKAQISGYDQIVDLQNQKYDLKEKQYQKSIKANKTNKTVFGIIIGGLLGTIGAVTIYAVTK